MSIGYLGGRQRREAKQISLVSGKSDSHIRKQDLENAKMSKTSGHNGNFLLEMKPLYYVAKILGLAPFSFKINPVTNEEIVDIKFTSNIVGFTISAFILITLLIGFVIATIQDEFSLNKDPEDALCHAVSVPLNFTGAVILVIMNLSVNRFKMKELVKTLSLIDGNLYLVWRGRAYHRGKRNAYLYMPILAVVVSLIYFDAFVWCYNYNISFCFIERSCHIITLVAMMQFCKVVQMITCRLSAIHELLSSTFSEKSAHTNTSYALRPIERSHTNKTYRQTSSVKQVATVDSFSNSILFQRVTSDLKTLPVSEVQTILNLRRIYNHIYECSKVINFMFGLPVLIDMSRTGTGLISALYSVGELFSEPTEARLVSSRIIWTTVLLGTMISLTLICETAASRVRDIAHKLQTLLLENPLRSDLLQQLQLFSQQISKDRIEFTAAGFFVIDLSLLCTFLTSVTTYIVVLIQFKTN